MKEKLDSILAKDEELLWFGSPEAFETMDKTNGKRIKTGIIIKAIIMAALIAVYIIISADAGFKVGILILLLALAAYMIANPFIVSGSLRKTGYAVTDKRLIQISTDAKGVEYAAIGDAVFKTDSDGHITLLCGKDAVKLDESKWRGAAASPVRVDEEKGVCECLVFYALPEADKVKALISQYITL